MSALTLESSITFIIKFVEVAQKNGSYILSEADTLQKAVQVCSQYLSKPEVTQDFINSLNLLINGIVNGQSKGSYSLAEASLLYNIVMFFQKTFNTEVSTQEPAVATEEPKQHQSLSMVKEEEEELYGLSDPVPISDVSSILEL